MCFTPLAASPTLCATSPTLSAMFSCRKITMCQSMLSQHFMSSLRSFTQHLCKELAESFVDNALLIICST